MTLAKRDAEKRSADERVGGVERRLADERKRLDETRASLNASRTIIAGAGADRDAIAAREVAGEFSSDRAAREFHKTAQLVERHVAEVDRLERVCALIANEIRDLEREAAEAAYDDAVARAHELQEASHTAFALFVKTAATAAASAGRRSQARTELEAAIAVARELQPDGVEDALWLNDEPEWPDAYAIAHLVETLTAGPRRPDAVEARSGEAARRQREHADAEQVRLAVNGALASISRELVELEINRLPEPLRERAWNELERTLERRRAEQAARDAAERERRPDRVLRGG